MVGAAITALTARPYPRFVAGTIALAAIVAMAVPVCASSLACTVTATAVIAIAVDVAVAIDVAVAVVIDVAVAVAIDVAVAVAVDVAEDLHEATANSLFCVPLSVQLDDFGVALWRRASGCLARKLDMGYCRRTMTGQVATSFLENKLSMASLLKMIFGGAGGAVILGSG